MRPKFGFLLLAIPALVTLDACSADTPPYGDAVACSEGGGFHSFRPGDTIPVALYVKNDGNWCGVAYRFDGSVGSSAAISTQPTHGAARVRPDKYEDGRLRATGIYYRPDPGFTGRDTFSVMVPVNGWTMNFTVHVRADTSATPKTATAN
jgi:hypothetical protein